MRINLLFKNLLVVSTITLGISACGDTNKAEDPIKVAEEHNEQKFDNEKEKTADFMVYAADLNLHEIQMAELATGNAYDGSVKTLAKKITEDHQKAYADLKRLSSERTVTLPESTSDEHKKDCEKLGKKTKKDFDEDFCDMMVKGHEKAISRFEKEAEEGKDEVIRQWAFDMLPTLRTHLDMAIDCQKKTGTHKNNKDTGVVVKNYDDKAHRQGDDHERKKVTAEDELKKSEESKKAESKSEAKTKSNTDTKTTGKKDW